MQPDPTLSLNDGTAFPKMGFGTWRLDDAAATEMVGHAIGCGYRLIDTAKAYDNETGVGQAVRAAEVDRDALFITSKVWNDDHGYDATLRAFDGSMQRLGLEVMDLYLIHWPVPEAGLFEDSWKALVRLKSEGRVRQIGVSNFRAPDLDRIIDDSGVTPAVNQIELHPRFQQRSLRALHERLGIRTESWSPLGQGNLDDDPVLAGIAARLGKSVPQVVLRWHLEQGLIAIPRSGTPAHIAANRAILDFTLSEEDHMAIARLDTGAGRIGPDPSTFTDA
ncbi:aldo/keto reductase [Pseudoruegeria sp. SK021]|uniref:aldo/keto reductase n=1 Tax=Pseudoruegeria sp. SK021 TaxID=1933035 RepID=UPI000A22F99B|nr:aldo/keto reductase [Pseudoruegeria sp. SK021]OSP54037.1 oxidoreductase [Pseudoruegeria sp. SK021]